MSAIESDRGWRFQVARSSEYWADRHEPDSIGEKYGDTVRVDAYDHDASIELTPVEARSLAAALVAEAERIEPASASFSAVESEVVDLDEAVSIHESSPLSSGPGTGNTGVTRAVTVQETADIPSPGVGAAAGAESSAPAASTSEEAGH